jgi:hypothetical protein
LFNNTIIIYLLYFLIIFAFNLNIIKMKKYWYIAVVAISLSFTACGDDSTPTPAAPTTDEIIGTYTGTELSLVKFSEATNGATQDVTVTDTDIKLIITKGSTGYMISIDDNNPNTPVDPENLVIQDVLIASNGTTFRIPAQEVTVDNQTVIIQGTAYAVNGTTPVAGLYTRNDKALRFEFEGVLELEDANGNPFDVDFEVEYNTNKQ